VPESGICLLPEFVSILPLNHPALQISIKKDRNFLFFSQIPLGTTVVLEPPDTSRSARLTRERKAGGASNLGIYLLRSKKSA
jgi:hypothetical protein